MSLPVTESDKQHESGRASEGPTKSLLMVTSGAAVAHLFLLERMSNFFYNAPVTGSSNL